MKTLTQAFAKTAAVIEKHVQTTVQEVTGPKALQDYELLDQIGSGGPGLVWKLYSAKARSGSTLSQYPIVCVWVLDKKAITEARSKAGLSKTTEDAFYDIIRADASRLVRIRHPGVVHVVQGLDENKNFMAMVTEPLFASVANTLGNVENIGKVPKELKGMEMGLLEVKHGLLQIAESLDFLHNNAHLIHPAISPETIFITSSGAWKLGGFGFAIPADQNSGELSSAQPFHYSEYDVDDSLLPLQPSLNYTAPELVRSKAPKAGWSTDMFSFGCLAYHLIAHKPLLDCHNNVKMYMNTLSYLQHESFSSMPADVVNDLQRMLSMNEASRPSALDFTGSPFFRDDTRLRALRFLDHMLERDNMQKSEFLKALSDMWKDFDSRVLRYKVLPPLCAELRNMVLQPMILPMVLTIAESQIMNYRNLIKHWLNNHAFARTKMIFEVSTLPALFPVLSTAAGETLLLIVKHAELIINKTSQEHLISHVLPLLVRAYDDNDARIQEEVLRRTAALTKQLDVQLVKQAVLPCVHGLALKTTVAAVRVNALLCLGELVSTMDKHATLEILQTIQRCTAVDHSAPTLMCTFGSCKLDSQAGTLSHLHFYAFHGIEFVAEHVLPLLMPLLIAQQLNVQQFAKYMLFVKDILRKIEEKRGVSVTDSGTPEIRVTPVLNGTPSQPSVKTSQPVSSAANSRPAWDEDWGPITKGPQFRQSSDTSLPSVQKTRVSQPVNTTPLPSVVSPSSNQQIPTSCPSVDLEWPPRSTSGVSSHLGDTEKPKPNTELSSPSFDEIDPFANWPPRSSNSVTSSGFASSNSAMGMSSQHNGNSFFSTNNQNTTHSSAGFSRQNQGNSLSNTNILNSGGLNNQSSLGFMRQNQGSSAPGISNPSAYGAGSYTEKTATDIGSIFSSNKTENTGLRLAPPPLTAVGRGRGRGTQGSRSSKPKPSSSEQPPLLDLL
ncbi:hypothetical protein MKW92_036371 [Papaver armeniacum]|nr:hypothetical protein MKW92_036371 [Papaver armeniacum]